MKIYGLYLMYDDFSSQGRALVGMFTSVQAALQVEPNACYVKEGENDRYFGVVADGDYMIEEMEDIINEWDGVIRPMRQLVRYGWGSPEKPPHYERWFFLPEQESEARKASNHSTPYIHWPDGTVEMWGRGE